MVSPTSTISNTGGCKPSLDEYLAAFVLAVIPRNEYNPSPVMSEVKSSDTQVSFATVPNDFIRVAPAAGALFQLTVSSVQELSNTW